MRPAGRIFARQRQTESVPEGLEFGDAIFRGIAGNDRRIDGADRDAGDPVGPNALGVQHFVDAGLIGAQGAAALQNKNGLAVGQTCGLG